MMASFGGTLGRPSCFCSACLTGTSVSLVPQCPTVEWRWRGVECFGSPAWSVEFCGSPACSVLLCPHVRLSREITVNTSAVYADNRDKPQTLP